MSGLGEPAIIGADDTAAETNGRTNEWWRLEDSSLTEIGAVITVDSDNGLVSRVQCFLIICSFIFRTHSRSRVAPMVNSGRSMDVWWLWVEEVRKVSQSLLQILSKTKHMMRSTVFCSTFSSRSKTADPRSPELKDNR